MKITKKRLQEIILEELKEADMLDELASARHGGRGRTAMTTRSRTGFTPAELATGDGPTSQTPETDKKMQQSVQLARKTLRDLAQGQELTKVSIPELGTLMDTLLAMVDAFDESGTQNTGSLDMHRQRYFDALVKFNQKTQQQ